MEENCLYLVTDLYKTFRRLLILQRQLRNGAPVSYTHLVIIGYVQFMCLLNSSMTVFGLMELCIHAGVNKD